MKKLSIIVPVYNEEKNIETILGKVKKVKLRNANKEIIVVDDGSTDRTKEILKKIKDKSIKVIYHKRNMGKGCAIRTALNYVSGDIVLVQDADLEYDPKDYPNLITPIIEGKAKVVYGSRLLGREHAKYVKFAYYIAGTSLTVITNLLYGTKITDEPCGYKVFSYDVIKKLKLKCKRFEFCPEVTAKIIKKGIKIYEVPSSYNPRTRKEGKKIKFKDWLEAVYTLLKYKFVD